MCITFQYLVMVMMMIIAIHVEMNMKKWYLLRILGRFFNGLGSLLKVLMYLLVMLNCVRCGEGNSLTIIFK